MVKRLREFVGTAKAEDVLIKAFVEVVKDGVRGGQVEDKCGDKN